MVGGPLVLVRLGQGVALARWLVPGRPWLALLRPDDGTLLLGVLTFFGWVAWASFAWSVATELAYGLRPPPNPRARRRWGPLAWAAAALVGTLLVLPVPAAAGTGSTAGGEPGAGRDGRSPTEHVLGNPLPTAPTNAPANATILVRAAVASAHPADAPALVRAADDAGALLATLMLGTLGLRRQRQLISRAPGRRLPRPEEAASQAESALAAAHDRCVVATVAGVLAVAGTSTARESILKVPGAGARSPESGPTTLGAAAGDGEIFPAVPAASVLGTTDEGDTLLVDLVAMGRFAIVAPDASVRFGVARALLASLTSATWAGGVRILVAGTLCVPSGEGATCEEGLHAGDVLGRAELRSLLLPGDTAGYLPEVHVLLDPSPDDLERVASMSYGRGPDAVVVALPTLPSQGTFAAPCGAQFVVSSTARGLRATLLPEGIEARPALLDPVVATSLRELGAVAESLVTAPAPWWDGEALPGERLVEMLDSVPATPRRRAEPPPMDQLLPSEGMGDVGSVDADPPPPRPRVAASHLTVLESSPPSPDRHPHHPTVLLLGPIDLHGAAGPPPARARRQLVEYCAWLLEHPGSSAPEMASALLVAEGTRRSNVSRLRAWLGNTPTGQPYLPDAYSGRLELDGAVSSDWQRLQILVRPGVNRVDRRTLVAALGLVRGAPLADASPWEWRWAEPLRLDMCSLIRDLGIVLADDALRTGDLDLARWAVTRALAATPRDERLVCRLIVVEHREGRAAEVERLALQLDRHARVLGVDLDDQTVRLLQRVMEGQVRVRL